jgi:hypothetical protein
MTTEKFRVLSPEQGVRAFEDDPSSIFISLADFIHRYEFSQEELLRELRSGRLVSGASRETLNAMPGARLTEFTVSFEALRNWMANPRTPAKLITKFKQGIERKPQ